MNQFVGYLDAHSLAEPFQSDYKKHHSTDTTLTFVTNNILKSLNSKRSVILILLNLLATFDMVDYQILLTCLEHHLGALTSFKPYFTNHA